MNNDIIPPRPPSQPPRDITMPVPESNSAEQPYAAPQAGPLPVAQPSMSQGVASPADEPTPEKKPKKTHYKWIAIVVGLGLLVIAACIGWYILALRPVASGDQPRVQVTIPLNSSSSQIGALLQEKKVIRSKIAFQAYVRLGTREQLHAGTYSLSPAESTAQIVNHLTVSSTEQYDVTFYPGATLSIASTMTDKTPSHRQVLQKLGFSNEEIDEAFNASYDEEFPTLFADKPASADLEGYIYGQTYKVASGSTVKQILRRTFDEYQKQIIDNNLAETFKSQGLTVYEGITLASIIQREVPTAADQKQVAQIFLKRYRDGETLGSDVTYHYAADKRGVPRTHTLDDPYNTRINPGLPPGPIASPGISSLLAVASPADGDYVFFLSGDDDKTYFARTQAEHEANIVNHCTYKCSLP